MCIKQSKYVSTLFCMVIYTILLQFCCSVTKFFVPCQIRWSVGFKQTTTGSKGWVCLPVSQSTDIYIAILYSGACPTEVISTFSIVMGQIAALLLFHMRSAQWFVDWPDQYQQLQEAPRSWCLDLNVWSITMKALVFSHFYPPGLTSALITNPQLVLPRIGICLFSRFSPVSAVLAHGHKELTRGKAGMISSLSYENSAHFYYFIESFLPYSFSPRY